MKPLGEQVTRQEYQLLSASEISDIVASTERLVQGPDVRALGESALLARDHAMAMRDVCRLALRVLLRTDHPTLYARLEHAVLAFERADGMDP